MTGTRYDADEIEDPYSYRGTACLKNKLGLRDAVGIVIKALHVSDDHILPKLISVGLPYFLLEQWLPLLPPFENLTRCQLVPFVQNGPQ